MPVSQHQNKNLTSKMKVQGGKTLAYTLVLNPNFLRKLEDTALLFSASRLPLFPKPVKSRDL